ncbi:MAG: methylenetetrahydrofolate reductase [Anaerolineales bacterium]|jgi:methylenetetrahydrofolate reductase (NADPH)
MGVVTPASRLERVLRSGRFAVTAELDPPDSADPQAVYDRALVLASVCDAINATDASGANVHMSSVGVCALLTRAGYEPVLQVSCRDRNRIAIQGDLLGAAAMGVRNVLCLTGDGVQNGDQPEARPVFDLDSVSLLRLARMLRDEGRFLSGRMLESPPHLFLGASANPFAPPFEYRPVHLGKKVQAGAQFIQTQYCFDLPRLRQFMHVVREEGLDRKAFILVGVGPLRSWKVARWMSEHVPGVVIPEPVLDHLSRTPGPFQREEGKRLCVDLIRQIREIPGVSGIHVMAYRQESLVAEIVEEAGLIPRQTQVRPPEPAAA